MKRKMERWLAGGCLVGLLLMAVWLLWPAQTPATAQARVGRALGLALDTATVLTEQDDHGGFHGDGQTFIALQLVENSLPADLPDRAGWAALPLDHNAAVLLYGETTETASRGPYLHDEAGNPLLPPVAHGYWYFQDRQAAQGEKLSAEAVLGRPSMNWTAAVYDADARILYYMELDT